MISSYFKKHAPTPVVTRIYIVDTVPLNAIVKIFWRVVTISNYYQYQNQLDNLKDRHPSCTDYFTYSNRPIPHNKSNARDPS